MTDSGTTVGRVAAIEFGDSSHSLVALEVTGEGSDDRGRILASEIQTIGPDMIIIADPPADGAPVRVRSRPVLRTIVSEPVHDIEPRRSERIRVIGA